MQLSDWLHVGNSDAGFRSAGIKYTQRSIHYIPPTEISDKLKSNILRATLRHLIFNLQIKESIFVVSLNNTAHAAF
jgi:hypothetical protein